MTTIVLISSDYDMSHLIPVLQVAAPDVLVVKQDDPKAQEAEVAVCWNPPPGFLARLPKLRLIHAIAAGVDNILADPLLPPVPLCRVVDPAHARGMCEYVSWGVLYYFRQFDLVLRNQQLGKWFRPEQKLPASCRVGVMGLGEIGRRVANDLHASGFSVRGWARQERVLPGVEIFYGQQQLACFLNGCDILVCLLPLTDETRGILSQKTFSSLPHGAKLIQVGRGEHLCMTDLEAALSSGQIGGAIVDVFEKEPLPADHPLWRVPNLMITPHMASTAQSETIAAQIANNVHRLIQGEPLCHEVDRHRGY